MRLPDIGLRHRRAQPRLPKPGIDLVHSGCGGAGQPPRPREPSGRIGSCRRPRPSTGPLYAGVGTGPRHANAHNNLAIVLTRRGDFDTAIEHYLLAIEFKAGFFEGHRHRANDFYAHYNLGLAQLSLNDNAQAFEQFRQALAIDPNSAEARQNLAAARAAEQDR